MRRALALFLVLLAAYAATIGLDARPGQRLTTTEAHQLLTAESIVSDGDIELHNQYIDADYRKFGFNRLRPSGRPNQDGLLHEPQGIATPLLIAPAYAIGGVTGVELFCAALLALAFTLAAALARRLVPEPWASGAALACGLSPPALGAATAIGPDAAGAALLAACALLALRVREVPLPRWSIGCAMLVATLPWLSPKFIVPTAVIGAALARWLRNRGRAVIGFVCLEVILTSAIVYVMVNDRVFGGFTPLEAKRRGTGGPTGADSLEEHLARADRLLGIWIDRHAGLLVLAPIFALAFAGVWALWRSKRDRLAIAVTDRLHVEVAALLYVLVALAILLVAVFAAPQLLGPWFPGHELVAALPFLAALCAWGLRRHPRLGTALAVVTLVQSAWLLIAARLDADAGLQPPTGRLPPGGLRELLPAFAHGGAYPVVAGAVVGAGLALLIGREWRDRRPV